MAPISSTVAQWELASRLRDRRNELDLSSEKVARRAGFSRAHLSNVENEHILPSVEQLNTVLDVLGFDDRQRRELAELLDNASHRGWWTEHAKVCGDKPTRLAGMEHGATRTRVYQSVIFPELLQCESYARALMSTSPFVRRAEVDRLTEVRMRRQKRLHDIADPLRYTAVVSQAALRQQVGGPETQRAQLRHVAELMHAHPDHVDVRVLPETSSGRGIFAASAFQLLDFPSRYLPLLCWHESVTVRDFIDDSDQLDDFGQVFDSARQDALSRDETLALLDAG